MLQPISCSTMRMLGVLLLAFTVLCPTTSASDAAGGSATATAACRSHLYATDCLSEEAEAQGCFWCCSSQFGSQCKSKGELCSMQAKLTSLTQTCGDLCDASTEENPCAKCERRNWCYFCRSSGKCQAPEAHCSGNAIVQSCEVPSDDDDDSPTGNDAERAYIIAVSSVGGTMAAVSLLIMLGIECWRRWRRYRARQARQRRRRARREAAAAARQRQQQLQEQQQQLQEQAAAGITADGRPASASADGANSVEEDENENRPLLASHREDEEQRLADHNPEESPLTDDADAPFAQAAHSYAGSSLGSEAVCYLCLDARPTVTFLPCYHTCCCEACSNRLRPSSNELICPFCRAKIDAMVSLCNVLFDSPPSS